MNIDTREAFGLKAYDDAIRVEKPRIEVILSSAIPPEMCKKIGLGYIDPATVNPDDFRNREDEGILFVEKAGEILYRIKSTSYGSQP